MEPDDTPDQVPSGWGWGWTAKLTETALGKLAEATEVTKAKVAEATEATKVYAVATKAKMAEATEATKTLIHSMAQNTEGGLLCPARALKLTLQKAVKEPNLPCVFHGNCPKNFATRSK